MRARRANAGGRGRLTWDSKAPAVPLLLLSSTRSESPRKGKKRPRRNEEDGEGGTTKEEGRHRRDSPRHGGGRGRRTEREGERGGRKKKKGKQGEREGKIYVRVCRIAVRCVLQYAGDSIGFEAGEARSSSTECTRT